MSFDWIEDKNNLNFLKQVKFDKRIYLLHLKKHNVSRIYGSSNKITRISKKINIPMTYVFLYNNQLTYVPEQLINDETYIYNYSGNPININPYTLLHNYASDILEKRKIIRLTELNLKINTTNEKMKLWSINFF